MYLKVTLHQEGLVSKFSFLFSKLLNLQTCIVVPFVNRKVMITGDGDDGRGWDRGMRVRGYVCHRRVGQELHDHTHVIRRLAEHHG